MTIYLAEEPLATRSGQGTMHLLTWPDAAPIPAVGDELLWESRIISITGRRFVTQDGTTHVVLFWRGADGASQ